MKEDFLISDQMDWVKEDLAKARELFVLFAISHVDMTFETNIIPVRKPEDCNWVGAYKMRSRMNGHRQIKLYARKISEDTLEFITDLYSTDQKTLVNLLWNADLIPIC